MSLCVDQLAICRYTPKEIKENPAIYRKIESLKKNLIYSELSAEELTNWWQSLESFSDVVFVAEARNSVVGYAEVGIYDVYENQMLLRLEGFAVSGEFQKKGIGTLLLDHAISASKDYYLETTRFTPAGVVIFADDGIEFYNKFFNRPGFPFKVEKRVIRKFWLGVQDLKIFLIRFPA